MEDLQITPQELKNSASTMKTKIATMKDSLDVASNVIGRTSDSFKGSAAEELREKYNTLAMKFNDFYSAMTNYADFLEKTAVAYEQSDAAIKKAAEEVLTSEYSG